jgi:hypothetical protein
MVDRLLFLCVVVMGMACGVLEGGVDGHYYVQPGEIFVSPKGIYASIDGNMIQIYTLRANEQGVFVPYDEIVGALDYCPFCQSWYDPDYGHSCDGPRD